MSHTIFLQLRSLAKFSRSITSNFRWHWWASKSYKHESWFFFERGHVHRVSENQCPVLLCTRTVPDCYSRNQIFACTALTHTMHTRHKQQHKTIRQWKYTCTIHGWLTGLGCIAYWRQVSYQKSVGTLINVHLLLTSCTYILHNILHRRRRVYRFTPSNGTIVE